MSAPAGPLFGKFRGVVSDNRDPLMLGRVRAKVQDVFGDNESGWALPALPYAGKSVGLFLVPPTDAWVWIEFEHGDPDYPIWTGCFWAQGEVPASPGVAEMKVLKTDAVTVTLNDMPGAGGVKIETTLGMKVVISATGIEIDNGMGASIKLSGPQVSINGSALEVM
ncbi:phage baseplate assembly protein V [Janthinobacterium fluminis]|uniref:Phage baseplate assembly protein V n=1 Tax=Janthinobacterium fluminis TaxID=2987524 RepID=A0ABT5JW97_9BURK|nr:phage baseplate assembly protein V [Janthinobacterium fluminis]MDC8757006.1 phage baseplate assembly protein V [Janthinobacterium fluminis]